DELEAQADRLAQPQRAPPTGVWRSEPNREHSKRPAHMAAIYGFAPAAAGLPLESSFARTHPAERGQVERDVARTMDTGTPCHAEVRVLPRPGVERWVRESGGRVVDSQGRSRITGTVVDVTEGHEARERVERAEAQFRALFERNPLPF